MTPSYVRHATGVAGLLAWISRCSELSLPVHVKDSLVYMSPSVARRIALGVPRHIRYGHYPFLGFQTEERIWIERISWSRLVHIQSSDEIVLVSKSWPSSSLEYVGIPSFGLIFTLDDPRKRDILLSGRRVQARALSFDAAGEIQIASGAVLWSVPVKKVATLDEVFNKDDLRDDMSFTALSQARLASTNIYHDPGYKGSRVDLPSDLASLTRPFRKEDVPGLDDFS